MPTYSVKCPIHYGLGSIKILGERAKGFGASKVMLVYSSESISASRF